MSDSHLQEPASYETSRPASGFATRRNLALGLLVVCVLSVVLGVIYQERELTELANRPAPEEEGGPTAIVGVLKRFKGKSLAHIVLDGPIEMKLEQGVLGEKASNAVQVRRALDAVAEDDRIRGVLLSINSPGGTVGMSQELHEAVERVREQKPVVAHFGDVAASGGYYTAVAADRIVSNPGTLTASIGVIISGFNVRGLMNDKLGIKANIIKSGKHKDMLSPYREPSPEDIALLQNIVNTTYGQFLGVVLEGRTKHIKDKAEIAKRQMVLKEVADGRVVTGEQGLDLYLVDSLGDIHDAQLVLDALVRERFKLPESAEPMDLEHYGTEDALFDVIRLPFGGSLSLAPVLAPLERALSRAIPQPALLAPAMPLSAQYPRQPLWIME